MISDVQPICPCCGHKLRKETRTVWCGQQNTDSGLTYRGIVEKPTSRDECQRLTNWQVTGVRYRKQPAGEIRLFFEWDGKSYHATAGVFCRGECAELFAAVAHAAGFRLKRYLPRD